jgi:type IV pilus assembly protein PilV
MNMSSHLPSRSRGFNLLEVLVALVVVMIGLLGIAGLQARAHTSELESYQRAQALVLLYDMVDRINNNRLTASCFAVTTDTTNGTPYLGTVVGGGHFSTPTTSCGVSTTQNNTLANNSINAWDDLLRGASEKKGAAATEVGAMIGARGCISYNTGSEYVDAATGLNIAGTGEYTISVAWQGMADTFAPTVSCGKNLYATETKRRTVWVTTRLGTLIAR